MIYLQRLAAIFVVFCSLIIVTVGFPFFAAVYVYSGRDLTDKILNLMPGK